MDFFQAQDNAIRKTKRLILYYTLAVIAIVISVYAAVTIGFIAYDVWSRPENYPSSQNYPLSPIWDIGRFLLVAIVVVALVGLGSLYKTIALRGGGSAVAKSLGGERVDRSTRNPKRKQLLNVVEEMAIASGIPVPEVYILPHEASINAFAAGWGIDDAVIAVSAGALEKLNRDELQGVVAHEYSHVMHGDCRLNIRLMGVLFGIMMLTVFGRILGALFGGGRRRRGGGAVVFMGGGRRGGGRSSGGGKGNGGALVLAVILVVVLVTIIGYIGTFFGRLIQAAISRQREYLADAAAVQYTRNPDGIAGALKKIGGMKSRGVIEHPSASEAAHMFFADGLRRSFYTSAFATHPPLKARIREIQPDWDGKVEHVEEKAPEPSKPQSQSSVKQSADGRKFIEGMAVLGAIGTMGDQNLRQAREITTRIPESLDESMREEEGAKQAIVSLIMADNKLDDEEQWKVVEVAIPPDALDTLKGVYEVISDLPRETRLAVLELATSTLAQSHIPDQDDYLTLLNNLIQTDSQLTLYELCIRRILRERLSRGEKGGQGSGSVQYMQLKPKVAQAVGNLLSVLAREVAGARDPSELMARSLRAQYLLNNKVGYEEASEGDMVRLDRSLDILKVSAFAIRAQVLRAVAVLIKADGRLSAEEAEALRMLSLSLDCPVPPLGF